MRCSITYVICQALDLILSSRNSSTHSSGDIAPGISIYIKSRYEEEVVRDHLMIETYNNQKPIIISTTIIIIITKIHPDTFNTVLFDAHYHTYYMEVVHIW
jgi:hypothetical protein